MKKILSDVKFPKVVDEAVGLDGRQIRKAVLGALTLDIEAVLNPNKLTIQMLLQAMKQAKVIKQ